MPTPHRLPLPTHPARRTRRAACALLLGIACAAAAQAQAQAATWTWANPLPQGNALRKVAYGNGRYVAVGDLGTLLTSTDGRSWQVQATGVQDHLLDVTYAQGVFVAVGWAILTSRDATHWTVRRSNLKDALRGVAFGHGRFVAAGARILTSPDGRRWQALRHPPPFMPEGVIFAGNRFLIIGASTMTSADGTHWTARRGKPILLDGVVYDRGRFTAVSTQFNDGVCGAIFLSSDASHWTRIRAGTPHNSIGSTAIAYGRGRYVAVGYEGDVLTSRDGRRWRHVQPSEPAPPGLALTTEQINLTNCFPPAERSAYGSNSVIWAGGQFVAVGDRGAILTSPDGLAWTARTTGTERSFYHVAFLHDRFVATGSFGIATSADGRTWETHPTPPPGDASEGLAYGQGLYVAVGGGSSGGDSPIHATVFTSTDAVTWQAHTWIAEHFLRAVAYGAGRFVAVDGSGTIWSSSDAVAWTALPTPPSDRTYQLREIIFAGGRFVAVGDRRAIATSANGSDWTVQSVTASGISDLRGVAWGNGRFIAVGDFDTRLTSADGVTWTAAPPAAATAPGLLDGMQALVFANGRFLGVGYGTLLSSTDGAAWVAESSSPPAELRNVAYGNGRFVAAGFDALLTRPEPASPPAGPP